MRGGDGAPPLEARISRAVYYELVALAVPCRVCGRDVLGVWSENRFFSLGEVPHCADAEDGLECDCDHPGDADETEVRAGADAGHAGD